MIYFNIYFCIQCASKYTKEDTYIIENYIIVPPPSARQICYHARILHPSAPSVRSDLRWPSPPFLIFISAVPPLPLRW